MRAGGAQALLAAELQDCLAARPLAQLSGDQERQLLSGLRKMRERRLADDFKRALDAFNALARSPAAAAAPVLEAARAAVERANHALNSFRRPPPAAPLHAHASSSAPPHSERAEGEHR